MTNMLNILMAITMLVHVVKAEDLTTEDPTTEEDMTEPMVISDGGELHFKVGAGKDIFITFHDETYSLRNLLAKSYSSISVDDATTLIQNQMTALEQRLRVDIDALDTRLETVEDLDQNFVSRVKTALNRYEIKKTWKTHYADVSKRDTTISIGKVHTDDVLKLNIMDTGCNSGIGLAMTVSATWGVASTARPVVFLHAAARQDLADQIKLYFKDAGAQDEYHLYLKFTGWGPCGGNEGLNHQTTILVESADGRFEPDTDSSVNFDSTFKPLPSAGDKIVKKVKWQAHNQDPAKQWGYIPVGLVHTEHILKIDVTDSGCYSGISHSYQISARWGVDRGSFPEVFTFGTTEESMEDRFQFIFKAKDMDEYYLYLRVRGWPLCASNPTATDHSLTMIIEPSDARFDETVDLEGTFNPNEFTVMEKSRVEDLYEMVEDLQDVDKFTEKVNSALNRKVLSYEWETHSNDANDRDGYFKIGTFNVDGVIHLDVSDSGCGSGIGMSFVITATYGLHRDPDNVIPPKAFTFGEVHPNLENKFKLFWTNQDQDDYHIILKIEGWGPCNGQENLKHNMLAVVSSSDPRFTLESVPDFNPDDFSEMPLMSLGEVADKVLPDEFGVVNLFKDFGLQVFNKQYTLTVTSAQRNQWQNLFARGGLPTGGYIFYVPAVHSAGKGGNMWREYFVSAPFIWYNDSTNDQTDQYNEDIDIHSLGHANNGAVLSFRTIRGSAPDARAYFQFKTSEIWNGVQMQITFLKMF